jgi:HEAT repeat protein
VREAALDRIGTAGPPRAFEIIAPLLNDPSGEVRGTAAANIGEIGDERAVPLLIDMARADPDEDVRSDALFSLDAFQSEPILRCLIDEVHRPKRSRRPRQIVARQLGKYSADDAVDALVELLADDDVHVRNFAVDSLHAQNRPRLRQVWRAAQDDDSPYVRSVAAAALADLAVSLEPQNGARETP